MGAAAGADRRRVRDAHPAFHTYTDIENYRNFPDLLQDGEEVVFTEKIHGKCTRVGLIRTSEGDGEEDWTFMAGSQNLRRKEFDAKGRRSQFWDCLTEPVRQLLLHVRTLSAPWLPPSVHGIVLFGELFGTGVQDMWYGLENRFSFSAFLIWPSTVATSISTSSKSCSPGSASRWHRSSTADHSAAASRNM